MAAPTLSSITVNSGGTTVAFTFTSTGGATGFSNSGSISGFSGTVWTSSQGGGQVGQPLTFAATATSSLLVVTATINNSVVIGKEDNVQFSYTPGNLVDNLGNSVAAFAPSPGVVNLTSNANISRPSLVPAANVADSNQTITNNSTQQSSPSNGVRVGGNTFFGA